MEVQLTLIAAVSKDGLISRGQGVPWDLPRDRAHFRTATASQWLLLGRRTYEEMVGWFQDHVPLVLTRDPSLAPQRGRSVRNTQEALELAAAAGIGEIFVCGGSAAYAAAMPLAHRLLITHVDVLLGEGIAFPAIDSPPWNLVSQQAHAADSENACAMTFAEYRRTNGGSSINTTCR